MPDSQGPSWIQIVGTLGPDTRPGPPAAEAHLAAAEDQLGLSIPTELRAFLIEADGLTDGYGSKAIWSAADLARRNVEFRTSGEFRELYMPFDHLLFFGEDGGGDLFAYAIQADGLIRKRDIFRWEHESDGRSWFARGLVQFLRRRFIDED